MLDKQQVQDFINKNGCLQNIGQIQDDTKKALDRAVRQGKLIKSREPWLGWLMPLKTTYTANGRFEF